MRLIRRPVTGHASGQGIRDKRCCATTPRFGCVGWGSLIGVCACEVGRCAGIDRSVVCGNPTVRERSPV